ncbi:hypothetical protein DFH07DRAFT_846120 [Mycena maculata]|uniref:F-box domain-containing protein n=1 Tax=Mycena maculata TaxID=230809 RepID=A0AAD7I2Y1_9AGAR|nr:hypothetical protein DFH07DRAFT_846120 [Mycena maculata]
MLHFQGLPPDVIFSIFAFCDICAVISTAQTCKHLHTLAFHRTVWFAFLDDLNRRHFLNDPNLRDLSTDELLTMLKRLINGPDTWALTQNEDFAPRIAQKIILHPSITTGPGRDSENEAKLLPGGCHVLLGNWNSLECWSVAEDRLVWSRSPAVRTTSLLGFAAEVLDAADNSIVVVLCGRIPVGVQNYLEIFRVNLLAGISEVLFAVSTLDTEIYNFCGDPIVCGDLVAIPTRPQKDMYLIINWKTCSALILACDTPHSTLRRRPGWSSQIVILPNHLLLKTIADTGMDEIYVLALADFAPHWTRLSGPIVDLSTAVFLTPVPVTRLPKLVTQRMDLSGFGSNHTRVFYPPRSRVSVREDPLRPDVYRVWVYVAREDRPYQLLRATLHGYRLSCAPNGEVAWREYASAPTPDEMYHRAITYSGHTLVTSDEVGHEIVAPTRTQARRTVELVGDPWGHVDVAAYSGAITYPTFNSIVILYFE